MSQVIAFTIALIMAQIEAERTEVLRLSAALTSLRTSSRQDLKAAQDREAALKAVLASESEVC